MDEWTEHCSYGSCASHCVAFVVWRAGRSVIPKSSKVHRLQENIDIFDFELTAEDIVRHSVCLSVCVCVCARACAMCVSLTLLHG